MKILCSLSSIEFSCEHFPGNLFSREASHPIFSIPQKKLVSYLGKWASGGLTETDSYLLFLALLKSSDLVEFRVPAIRTSLTPSIVALNIESLAKTILHLNTVTNPAVFPHYVVSADTRDLGNVRYWIENWEESFTEYKSGRTRDWDDRKLAQKESALERLIKNPHRPISSYSSQLADWSATAGTFPTFSLTSPFSSLPITCSDYWKQIIHKCASEESLFSIRRADLLELLSHCEDNIPIGSIFSNALFKVLRHALERQQNFLGLGDLDISRSTYEILESSDTVETANLRAAIQAAPEHPPRPEEYPSKLAYMRAKFRYDMSQKAAKK